MTVHGRPGTRLWLITAGEALVSADGRPLRVVGYGDAVGMESTGLMGHRLDLGLLELEVIRC